MIRRTRFFSDYDLHDHRHDVRMTQHSFMVSQTFGSSLIASAAYQKKPTWSVSLASKVHRSDLGRYPLKKKRKVEHNTIPNSLIDVST